MQVSAMSPRVPAEIRASVQHAIADLRVSVRPRSANYRAAMLVGLQNVAIAWGGACVSPAYQGHLVPLYFTCEAGHRFPMLAKAIRMGQWCIECAYDRAVIHSLDEARALAIARGGRCLSRRYLNTRDRMRWRCEAGHRWSASLEAVLRWRLVPGVPFRTHQACAGQS